MDGWSALLQNISTFILILALVIGFFVSGIFSDEFQTKADSIFFSTRLGRNKGVLSKIGAGLTIVSAFYAAFVFLYTFIVLSVLGTIILTLISRRLGRQLKKPVKPKG